VHIGGAGRVREERVRTVQRGCRAMCSQLRQEDLEQEFGTWRAKLVVDDPAFRVDWRSTQHSGVHPADRRDTMLHDPPRKLGLRCGC
jgi:hypothetical protein